MVGDGATSSALAIMEAFVLVRIGVFEDDVPGVNQAGQEAETAECDVDERVCAAYTTLDPHCRL
jgi:hypothetical protein